MEETHGDYGMGFGGGLMGIILIIALLGGGLGGLGGLGRGAAVADPISTLLNDNNNKNFQALSDQMNYGTTQAITATQNAAQMEAIRDADKQTCDAAMDNLTNFGTVRQELATGFGVTNTNTAKGFCDALAFNANAFCNTNQNIKDGFCDAQLYASQNQAFLHDTLDHGFANARLELCEKHDAVLNGVAENRYLAAMAELRTQAQMAAGFCDCKFQNQVNTSDIIRSGDANTQKILDKLACNEIKALEDKVAELRLGYSQVNQNAALIAALGPKCPVPAYPVWNNAPIFTPSISPQSFCPGSGCGCGVM